MEIPCINKVILSYLSWLRNNQEVLIWSFWSREAISGFIVYLFIFFYFTLENFYYLYLWNISYLYLWNISYLYLWNNYCIQEKWSNTQRKSKISKRTQICLTAKELWNKWMHLHSFMSVKFFSCEVIKKLAFGMFS